MSSKIPPKQYQQGWTEFFKLRFYLTPDVLIPRPETELLVDEAISLAKSLNLKAISFLDIGTGSGCIAISIAKNLPIAKIIATDISEKALKVAEKNSILHKVLDRIIFLKSDLLSAFHPKGVRLNPDIIVANLPYIPAARLMLIDPLVTEYEPRIALDGGKDGFELYRKLFSQIVQNDFFPKYLVAEIDEEQGETAYLEGKLYFPHSQVEIKKDLNKLDRILLIKF